MICSIVERFSSVLFSSWSGSVSSVVPAVACGGREFHLKKDSSSVEQGEQISWWHSAFIIVLLLELCLTFLCVYCGRA